MPVVKDKPVKVLLIEDYPDNADLIREILAAAKSAAIDLLHIPQVAIALKSLLTKDIDVVLLAPYVPDTFDLDNDFKIQAQLLNIPIIRVIENTEGIIHPKIGFAESLNCQIQPPINSTKLIHSIESAMEQQQLLNTIEQQAKNLEASEARFHTLEMLYELSRQLSYTLNYEELVRLMLAHLYQAVPHDVSASILLIGDLCHLFIQPTRTLSPEVQETIQQRLWKTFSRIRGNKSLIEEQEPYLIRTLEIENFDITCPPIVSLESSFQVPIITPENNEVIGLLFVGAETEEIFTEDQVRLLYTVANQASISIQRLRTLLAAEQQHLENLVENLPEGVLLLDTNQRILLANPAAWKYLALMQNKAAGSILTHLGSQSLEPLLTPSIEGNFCHEVVVEGPPRWVFKVVVQPLAAKTNSQAHDWLMVIQDDTESRRVEETLRLRDRAIAASSNGIVLVDARLPDLPVIYVNPAFEQITGYTAPEVIGRNCRFLQKHETNQLALDELRQALRAGKSANVVLRNYRKDGTAFWNELSISPIYDAEGILTHFVGIQTDITERKVAEEQLLHHAFYDALTDLPNRALFMDRLERAIAHAKRCETDLFAVLFLDLDRFKNVNDSLGHLIGDQMLIAIAKRLETSLRQEDTVARLGGDEFAILLGNVKNVGDAIYVAERIHQELTLPLNLEGHEVFTTASIGIALSSTGYNHPEEVLRDADIAMYRAKALGKARHEVFDKDMHAHAVALLQLETDLRRAIERQEFEVYYQPIVSLTNQQIISFESLVRWQHPERGLISPAEFIPLAEETGLINTIGWWVLRESCQQLRLWQTQFPSLILSISVNLSGKQFSQLDLIDQIAQVLAETGLEPKSLKLEITESAIMENVELASCMLWQLRKLGIQLYMDDFGTGYSSLSYLRRFPIDKLKIDRSFVSQMMVDEESLEIVRTIVMLARNLGMEAIAEGLETVEQLHQLKALQCDYAQGYFFSKPVNAQVAGQLVAGIQKLNNIEA